MPDLQIENIHDTLHIDRAPLEKLIRHVVVEENRSINYLGVILAGHDAVLQLNRDFLNHDYLTDVISFPLAESEAGSDEVNGEIYVDLDTAAERAPEFDTTFEEEARRYVVHGLLHLLGYDDKSPEGQATMRALEDKYLAAVPI